MSNKIQRVTFAVYISKLLVQIQIVYDGKARKFHLGLCSAEQNFFYFRIHSPRRHSSDFLFAKEFFNSIDKVSHIKLIHIPTSYNIDLRVFPYVQERTQKTVFILKLHVLYSRKIVFVFPVTKTKNNIESAHLHSDGVNSFYCLGWFWKSTFALYLNIDITDVEFREIILNIGRIFIRNERIKILVMAIYLHVIYLFILLLEFSGLANRTKLDPI